jgi:hypothetical protein
VLPGPVVTTTIISSAMNIDHAHLLRFLLMYQPIVLQHNAEEVEWTFSACGTQPLITLFCVSQALPGPVVTTNIISSTMNINPAHLLRFLFIYQPIVVQHNAEEVK